MRFNLPGRWPGLLVLASAAALAACGGGGDGGEAGGAGAGGEVVRQALAEDPDRAAVAVGVVYYDSQAAFDRIMNIAGYDRLPGPDGAYPSACAGGGTATVEKAGTVVNLTAANCKPSTMDNAVYDGRWTFGITWSTYAPDGSCAGLCELHTGDIDESLARFGYGAPSQRAGGGAALWLKSDAGVRSVTVALDAPFSADGVTIGVSSGHVTRSEAHGYGFLSTLEALAMEVSAPADRQDLTIRIGNFRAEARLGTDIRAVIDTTSIGTRFLPVTVDWSELVD